MTPYVNITFDFDCFAGLSLPTTLSVGLSALPPTSQVQVAVKPCQIMEQRTNMIVSRHFGSFLDTLAGLAGPFPGASEEPSGCWCAGGGCPGCCR